MDITNFFRKEYLTVDEIEAIKSGVATILGNAREVSMPVPYKKPDGTYDKKEIKVLYIDVQVAKTKEVRPVRLGSKGSPNQACKSLRRLYGNNTDQWTGKVVEFFTYKYGVSKTTLDVKPYDLNIEDVLP